jgi:hypothetical protein
MKGRRFNGVSVFLVLILASLACSLTAGGGATKVVDSDAIATYVAATVQAQASPTQPPATATQPAAAPVTPLPTRNASPIAPTATPKAGPAVLPSALYFIGPDKGGLDQVWRMPSQGYSVEQLTSEPEGVIEYVVSADGKLAYVRGNQLILIRPGLPGVNVVADGGADDGSAVFQYSHKIGSLSWSPDGKSLAYGLNGVHVLHVDRGEDVSVLTNKLQDLNGTAYPSALYRPGPWSPDSRRFAVVVSYMEGGNVAVFDTVDRKLVSLQKADGSPASCCTLSWALDGKALLSAGSAYGVMGADLWRYDPVGGQGNQLVPAQSADGTYNYVDWPILSPDGSLYYFFTGASNPISGPVAYQMLRSAADGVSQHTVLQSNPLYASEALWAPDASLAVVVTYTPGQQNGNEPLHGPIVILPSGGQPPQVIIQDGRSLMWGPGGISGGTST